MIYFSKSHKNNSFYSYNLNISIKDTHLIGESHEGPTTDGESINCAEDKLFESNSQLQVCRWATSKGAQNNGLQLHVW